MSLTDKRLRHQKIHAARVREILAVRFPNCFAPRGEAKKPLKIGIGFDVLFALPELQSYSVSAALEDYCSGRTYCESMVAGAVRYALDGSEAGFVSALEADHARKRLEAFERGAEAHKPREETVSP
jgi:ProP effector